MTETCSHRRSRLTTPLAMLLGAVLVSGTSAYAAATITGAQIADNSSAPRTSPTTA